MYIYIHVGNSKLIPIHSAIYPTLTYNFTITGYIHVHTQSQIGISTLNGISNSYQVPIVILIIGIQDLCISKYKYTIIIMHNITGT